MASLCYGIYANPYCINTSSVTAYAVPPSPQGVLRGTGGTDFRPVFKRVDEMIRDKEFTNLKGMLYFTDGKGTYPERQPGYQTAFVFVQDDYKEPEVPAWAIKLVLQNYELENL